jgi:hypothetical protein
MFNMVSSCPIWFLWRGMIERAARQSNAAAAKLACGARHCTEDNEGNEAAA